MRVRDRERAARHDGLLADDGAGRHGKDHRAAGRTAAAFRTLVALTAEKHGKRAQLDIRD